MCGSVHSPLAACGAPASVSCLHSLVIPQASYVHITVSHERVSEWLEDRRSLVPARPPCVPDTKLPSKLLRANQLHKGSTHMA